MTLTHFNVLGCKQQNIHLDQIADIDEGALKFMPKPLSGYDYIVVEYNYLD